MDEVEGMRGTVPSRGEGARVHLASQTGLADEVSFRRGRERDASSQTARDELRNVGSVVVVETFVPELEVKGTCRKSVRRLYSRSSCSIDKGSVVSRDSSSKQGHTAAHEVHEG